MNYKSRRLAVAAGRFTTLHMVTYIDTNKIYQEYLFEDQATIVHIVIVKHN